MAADIWVPLALGKTKGPTEVLSFLGNIIDTVRMEYHLPEDNLCVLKSEVGRAARLKKIQFKKLQSLISKLNYACSIIRMGRIFSRRLAAATAGVVVSHHYVRLGSELRSDLRVWASFLDSFNERAL